MIRLFKTGDGRPEVALQGLFIVFGFAPAAFFPFFAIYLQGRGLAAGQIGLVIAVIALARVVANPFWGHYADTRIGRLTALQVGAIGAAASASAMNLVHGLAALMVTASILAAFWAGTGANVDAMGLAHLGDERMADYGRIRGWQSASYGLGCLIFGTIMQVVGVRWAMPIFATACVVLLAWSVTIIRDQPSVSNTYGRLGTVGAVFDQAPRFIGFLVAGLLVWIAFTAAWSFVSLKIVGEHGGPALIGMGTALGGLVELGVMRLSWRLQRRLGLRCVYLVGCAFYAMAFLLWGLVSNAAIVSTLLVLEGIGFGLLFTTSISVVARLLPSSLYSTGNSIVALVSLGLGPIIGGGLGGFAYQHAGPMTLYLGATVIALLGGVVAWFALSFPGVKLASGVQREERAAGA